MANDGYLNIRYETLEQAQAELGLALQTARTTIDELKVKLEQNLADWNGDAREAYAQVKQEWDRAFAHMANVLEKAHVHMGNAHELYSQTERSNVTIWHK